jgi:hypothetical protein
MFTLPETDFPIKSLDEPASGGGAIVIRIDLEEIRSIQLIAMESDEKGILCQRLKAARPVLELLQKMFTVDTIGTRAEAGRS